MVKYFENNKGNAHSQNNTISNIVLTGSERVSHFKLPTDIETESSITIHNIAAPDPENTS